MVYSAAALFCAPTSLNGCIGGASHPVRVNVAMLTQVSLWQMGCLDGTLTVSKFQARPMQTFSLQARA